jgi:predicted Rossmann-fold nucleotide-binding protein
MALSLCVFCASASALPEVYHQAARRLGDEIARRGHRLIYGGGDVGLMGAVARAVHSGGGEVFGAIPRSLVERELLEVLTLRQLRLHDRPIVLVNVAGYWDPFLAMVRAMVSQGFAPNGEGLLFQVASTPEEAVDLVETGQGRVPTGAAPAEALAEDWTAEPTQER